ncbi:MAG: hypothetical protein K2X38_05115, partial [Gemmataceae bacterium]|nr:hypothetical protein [Gemmataceae bacterium]
LWWDRLLRARLFSHAVGTSDWCSPQRAQKQGTPIMASLASNLIPADLSSFIWQQPYQAQEEGNRKNPTEKPIFRFPFPIPFLAGFGGIGECNRDAESFSRSRMCRKGRFFRGLSESAIFPLSKQQVPLPEMQAKIDADFSRSACSQGRSTKQGRKQRPHVRNAGHGVIAIARSRAA